MEIVEKRPHWLEATAEVGGENRVVAVAERDVMSPRWGVRLIDNHAPMLDSTVEFMCNDRDHAERVIRFHARMSERESVAQLEPLT